MSLQGLQNYTFPLTLLGDTTIDGDFFGADIFVSGSVNGTGGSGDILGNNNVWTGTNDFQSTAEYTGINPAAADDLTTKEDCDTLITNYNPLPLNNTWNTLGSATTFLNEPPVFPISGVTDTTILCGLQDFNSILAATPGTNIPANVSNTWTGTNTFNNTFGTTNVSIEKATQSSQAATKIYVDTKLEVSGKLQTYVITTPGTYTFSNIPIGNVLKIEYILFGGSCSGRSGGVVSGVIGNGATSTLYCTIGTNADPSVVYISNSDTNSASTRLAFNNTTTLAAATGALNLNGTITPGGAYQVTAYNSNYTTYAAGAGFLNNYLAYGNILGTTTSSPGAIFTAYYV